MGYVRGRRGLRLTLISNRGTRTVLKYILMNSGDKHKVHEINKRLVEKWLYIARPAGPADGNQRHGRCIIESRNTSVHPDGRMNTIVTDYWNFGLIVKAEGMGYIATVAGPAEE
jgi:hypothetical protein